MWPGRFQLAPEKRKLVHLLELGKIEAPVLWVEASSLKLIQLDLIPGLDPKENLQNYLVYKLGAFSTVPVKLVHLTVSQRSLNSTMMRMVTTTTTTDLQQLTSDEDAGPTKPLRTRTWTRTRITLNLLRMRKRTRYD